MMNKKELDKKIVEHLKKEGANRVAIFGSYVRDQEQPGSDIDILVSFSETITLLDLVRIERELSEEIGIKVELLTEKSIIPYIREEIHREMKEVYG
jgi:predicted nucleotidyltransferase